MSTVNTASYYSSTSCNNTLPWIEKYRPRDLNHILSQNDIISTLKTFIKKRCLPHLLFYGPPGTGKTSSIIACARELYGKHYNFMVLKLNASDERGIEVVRNTVKQFVAAKNVYFGETEEEKKNIFRLVILDETDAMTDDAQAILRKIVEKYTRNTRFCLICNYIQNINPALQSRCTKFRFFPIDNNKIIEKIQEVKKGENLKVTDDGMQAIISRAKGDMRKVLNILQSVSMAHAIVNEENVNNCIGYPQKVHIVKILNSLIMDSFEKSYNMIHEFKSSYGLSLNDILQEIHDILVENIINEGKDNGKYYKGMKTNKLSIGKVAKILDTIRIVEYNQSISVTENIQLGALVGAFKI